MAAAFFRASRSIGRSSFTLSNCSLFFRSASSPSIRFFSSNTNGFNANPVAFQMINYALSLARSQKSDESYSQGLLVLEQCQSSQQDDNSRGMVLLAMSTLFSERGNYEDAIEKLQRILELNISSISIRVAATEALTGLHLELSQDDTSSVLTDICLQLLETIKLEIGIGCGFDATNARVKALRGLVELVRGDIVSAESFFHGAECDKFSIGNAVLSYGEFLHATRKFLKAKMLYEKVIREMTENDNFNDPCNLAACNMTLEEVLVAATCALGQVEAHMGNFDTAEEIFTAALKKAEQHFGSQHSKVGVVLTCIAFMYRQRTVAENSSFLLVQEGLYRKAVDLLKAPQMDMEEVKMHSCDIVALARGGYGEILSIQQNRKTQGERMKVWAEAAWKNRRLTLVEALDISESSSKVPVIDTRICRVL